VTTCHERRVVARRRRIAPFLAPDPLLVTTCHKERFDARAAAGVRAAFAVAAGRATVHDGRTSPPRGATMLAA
jgi:hypothetical protein